MDTPTEMLTLPSDVTFHKVGEVDVESGQVLLVDPCYIDNKWKHDPINRVRSYRNSVTGDVLQYPNDFASYEQLIEPYGLSMNQLKAGGEWSLEAELPGTSMTYNNCCLASRQPEGVGSVAGLGLSVKAFNGDDRYSVYAERDESGNILRLLIDFTVPEEE